MEETRVTRYNVYEQLGSLSIPAGTWETCRSQHTEAIHTEKVHINPRYMGLIHSLILPVHLQAQSVITFLQNGTNRA